MGQIKNIKLHTVTDIKMVTEKKMKKEEMANPTLYLDIDEHLQMVGDYHLFQKLILIIFFITTIPTFYQLLLMVFTTVSPHWRCHPNSTVCTSPITTSFSPKNTSRCRMNRCVKTRTFLQNMNSTAFPHSCRSYTKLNLCQALKLSLELIQLFRSSPNRLTYWVFMQVPVQVTKIFRNRERKACMHKLLTSKRNAFGLKIQAVQQN